jgi:hypothetical protein
MAHYRVPAANGEVLAVPDFAAIPGLVKENRRKLDRDDLKIGGLPLRELRIQAKRDALEQVFTQKLPRGAAEAPLLLTGHQPELAHRTSPLRASRRSYAASPSI